MWRFHLEWPWKVRFKVTHFWCLIYHTAAELGHALLNCVKFSVIMIIMIMSLLVIELSGTTTTLMFWEWMFLDSGNIISLPSPDEGREILAKIRELFSNTTDSVCRMFRQICTNVTLYNATCISIRCFVSIHCTVQMELSQSNGGCDCHLVIVTTK